MDLKEAVAKGLRIVTVAGFALLAFGIIFYLFQFTTAIGVSFYLQLVLIGFIVIIISALANRVLSPHNW